VIIYTSDIPSVDAGTLQRTYPDMCPAVFQHQLKEYDLNDLKLMINDLTFETHYAKYVNETSMLSVSKDVYHHKLY